MKTISQILIIHLLLSVNILLSQPIMAQSPQWKPVQGPLMTKWAKDVSPTNAHQEYPRPQMVRKDWMNLNGLWDIKLSDGTEAKILVPYPVESALSGVMKHSERLIYRRSFEVPKAWKGQRVLLHFGAVDWQTEVIVNGQPVGKHEGGYAPFSFDISTALKKVGPQEVIVKVWDPTDFGTQPRGKQVVNPQTIFYTSVTGIWQTVWIEPVRKTCITNIKAVSDIHEKTVSFTIQAMDGKSNTLTIDCPDFGTKVQGKTRETITMSVPMAKLWSPDSPNLYPIIVKLESGDEVQSYFAMRKTSLGKDKDGITRLMLNDKFIFQHGPLDQGWWPDGLYTAPTDAALKYDLEMIKSMSFNMLRKHIKTEPARFYYYCDRMGILVWQDMPSRSVGGDGMQVAGFDPLGGDAEKANFEREWKEIIEAFQFFPSIVMWVPFNEGWGQYDAERIAAWTKKLDPTRLVSNASGWVDENCGDIVDMHNYNGPGMFPVEEKRASVLGEYGGMGMIIKGHSWQKDVSWSYDSINSQNALFQHYDKINQSIHRLIGKGLSAAVYTQITDVEGEVNGLMTYDREVIKMPLEDLRASNNMLHQPVPKIKELLPNAQREGQLWSYTTDTLQVVNDWFAEDFDDSVWKKGKGGFGHVAPHRGAVVGTNWDTKDIWIRRTIELSAEDIAHPEDLFLDFYYDENVEIYFNGTLVCRLSKGTNSYVVSSLTPQAANALRAGNNCIAAHGSTTQTEVTRWQNIDIGLSRKIPSLPETQKKLMIPRVTKPWSEALLLVGDGKTLHSDFTLIKDKLDQWHCMGCFGLEPDGVGDGWALSDGYSLFHAVGSSFEKAMKILPKIHYQIDCPQAIMWAPGAIWNKDSTLAYMYYFHHHGWEWDGDVPLRQISPEKGCTRVLTSSESDLSSWEPYNGTELTEQNMAFREIDDRDFCVFWDERLETYLIYYCSSLASGPRVRTSKDLLHWSEPVTVLTAPAGDPHGYAESPFVLYRNGYYYLWVSGIDYSSTHLYISEDPFNFGDAIANLIEETPGHAPEIVFDKGVEYMACSMVSTYPSKFPSDHDLEGIYVQPIKWEVADTSMIKRIKKK